MQSGIETSGRSISIRNIDDQNMRSAHAFMAEANDIVEQIKSLSPAPVILGGAGYSIFPGALCLSQARHPCDVPAGIESFQKQRKCLLALPPYAHAAYERSKALSGKTPQPAPPRMTGADVRLFICSTISFASAVKA